MSGPQFQVQAAHLAEVAARLDVPFLDLTPQIRAREAAGEHLYWDYDHHLRPAGYAFVADALYAWAAAHAGKVRPHDADGGDVVAPGRARQPICFSSVSASETSYFPGASMLSTFTTPSSTSIEKRWQRIPRPFAVRSNSRPSALV